MDHECILAKNLLIHCSIYSDYESLYSDYHWVIRQRLTHLTCASNFQNVSNNGPKTDILLNVGKMNIQFHYHTANAHQYTFFVNIFHTHHYQHHNRLFKKLFANLKQRFKELEKYKNFKSNKNLFRESKSNILLNDYSKGKILNLL